MTAIDQARLAQITQLSQGEHSAPSGAAFVGCALEAVSWIAREPWSDRPACACPLIAAVVRSWNDALADADRGLLVPLVPRLVDTRGTLRLAQRRALMAVDWLLRTNLPAWLSLAGLGGAANTLSGVAEITDATQAPGLRATLAPLIAAAESRRASARAVAETRAGSEALSMATAAIWDPTRAAVWDAARDRAWDVGWDFSRGHAWGFAKDSAWDIVRSLARHASWAAAWSRTKAGNAADVTATKEALRTSCLALVDRMIALADAG